MSLIAQVWVEIRKHGFKNKEFRTLTETAIDKLNALKLGVVASGGYLDYGFQRLIDKCDYFNELELLYELYLGYTN